MAELYIPRWHVVIRGFTQKGGRPSGMLRLWRRLALECGQDTRIEYLSWKDDLADVAERIHNCRNGHDPDICISGYSYGGFSATLLAAELRLRGLKVRSMVLCDAVYRHRYFAGNWRSLMPWSKIYIPDNVGEVYCLRQKNPRFSFRRVGSRIQPVGHDLIPLSQHTEMHDEIVLTADHVWMDDCREFQDLALKVSKAHEPKR